MSVISEQTLTAKKEHRCNWCSQTIQKGEKYRRAANTYDGRLFTWKNHPFCNAIANELNMWEWVDEGLTEDDFHEEISEAYMALMSKHHNELYESEDFKLPDFKGKLKFVLDFYKIEHTF